MQRFSWGINCLNILFLFFFVFLKFSHRVFILNFFPDLCLKLATGVQKLQFEMRKYKRGINFLYPFSLCSIYLACLFSVFFSLQSFSENHACLGVWKVHIPMQKNEEQCFKSLVFLFPVDFSHLSFWMYSFVLSFLFESFPSSCI